jgi:hypothetical protein
MPCLPACFLALLLISVCIQRSIGILAKYGGEEHLNTLPPELLYAQSETYVEYTADGKIAKGLEKAVVKSKYLEDGEWLFSWLRDAKLGPAKKKVLIRLFSYLQNS